MVISLCGDGPIILLAFLFNVTYHNTTEDFCSRGFLLLADKHTYDTSLEVSEEFGSTIKNTLAILEPTGKFL